jgi:hypothetical protein
MMRIIKTTAVKNSYVFFCQAPFVSMAYSGHYAARSANTQNGVWRY